MGCKDNISSQLWLCEQLRGLGALEGAAEARSRGAPRLKGSWSGSRKDKDSSEGFGVIRAMGDVSAGGTGDNTGSFGNVW